MASGDFDPARFDPARGGPLVIVDREGEVLRRVPSRDGRPGRERWVPLSAIDSHAVLTLLASEDQGFYEHAGIDVSALARAAWLTLTTDRTYGGSTITQQLARMVGSTGRERSLFTKLLEARSALAIERRLGKGEILEQYLNRAYYGHGAYGIEAAAWRYFGRPARSLSAGEATLLAVLPRAPAHYDPVRQLGRVLERRRHLFGLLVAQGRMSESEVARAESQPIAITLSPFENEAPHFVDWVLETLPESERARGGVVRTSLDLRLSRALEHRTREHVRAQARWDVTDAGAVVLDARTAEVLAMVGSRDHAASEVNIVTRRRFPGSALKPFVYATAIERGMSPATIAYDVRAISPHYQDFGPERGPLSFRDALAGSRNYAAVHTIERAGVERVMERLRRAGVARLEQPAAAYGARLALGGARVRLLDLVAGYRFIVGEGRVLDATGVRGIERGGAVVWRPRRREREVFSAEASWLVMDVLADAEARRAAFGWDLPVDLPFDVVAKTGTAEGLSDALAVLATREILVGAWSGRLDGRPTRGRFGMTSAAPLARDAILLATSGFRPTLPEPPSSLEEGVVCPLSGLRPGPHCLHRRHERFVAGTRPRATCDWHQAGGRVAWPPELRAWARRTGQLAQLDRVE
ncbi:MAG: transglycosylase domain-containing protein [Sandaracinaceae bacterium]|nr:transglycosylase domain-containing protein [Sandaracinaceae bacterium]